VSGSARGLPTIVFVVVALVLLGLGGVWWTAARPPAGIVSQAPLDSAQAPAGSIVVLRLDNGKILKYESGGSVPATSWHRRCRGGLAPLSPGLRSVGQDNMVRC
jgi:hypothetical protein